MPTDASSRFTVVYGGPPDVVVRAPGRVNLIGEHTDYNDGFVLPMAINRQVLIAARRRDDHTVHITAENFGQSTHFSLDYIAPDRHARWSNYPRGIAQALQQAGFSLTGADLLIWSDVPIGSGLSSSAAIEMATIAAFRELAGFELSGPPMAVLGQKAENEFVGTRSGIMDQYISAMGRRDHALLIDCRSLDYRLVPLPASVRVVVADSGVRRGLVTSEYNTRREQCETAVRLLSAHLPGIRALRDVSPEQLARYEAELPEVVRRRAQHVVAENRRTLDAAAALENGQVDHFGALMDASHASLRDLYEVSSPELNALVEIARAVPGCLGARLTGAGFGGCTVSLVRHDAAGAVAQAIAEGYPARTGRQAEVYVCQATDGASVVTRDT